MSIVNTEEKQNFREIKFSTKKVFLFRSFKNLPQCVQFRMQCAQYVNKCYSSSHAKKSVLNSIKRTNKVY